MTTTDKRQHAYFYSYKRQKKVKIFLNKKPDTFQKGRQFALYFFIYNNPDTLHYAIFNGDFEIGNYTQKS